MRLGVVRARCARLLADLGIDGPTSVEELRNQLSRRRDRPIHLVAHPKLGEMSGFWIGTDDADTVYYDDALTGLHLEHVIAHELAHIAFGHGHDEVMAPDVLAALLPLLDPAKVRRMLSRKEYSEAEEREAEVFASMLLQLSADPAADALAGMAADARRRAADLAATFGSRRRDVR